MIYDILHGITENFKQLPINHQNHWLGILGSNILIIAENRIKNFVAFSTFARKDRDRQAARRITGS